MFKEQRFLEENIDRIQDYKKSDKTKYKDGYDKWETMERKFWEALTKIFFEIEEKLKTKEHKALFKEWFIEELNELYKDWLSPTEYRELEKVLTEMRENINYINSYNIETEFRKTIERLVKSSFKKSITHLEWKIISQENIDKKDLIVEFIKEIPFTKTSENVADITLDKKWSFSNDIKIKMVNLPNFWIQTQIFYVENGDNTRVLIKEKDKIKIYNNVENFKTDFNKKNIRISFETAWKKIILFNKKEQLYSINIPVEYYNKYSAYLWNLFYSKYDLRKLVNHDNLIYNQYLKDSWVFIITLEKKVKPKKEKKDTTEINVTNIEERETNNNKDILSNEQLAKLSTNERLKIIEKYLDSPEMNKYYNMLFNQLVWKKVYLVDEKTNKTKIITFTEKFIKKNKTELVNNLKSILLMVINIESDGNPLTKNKKWSTAIGLWQWLIWNWKYKKTKEWKKYYATSSWETTLNNIWKNYPEKISDFISWFPEKKITKPFNIKPQNIHWHDQIKILTLSLIWKKDEVLMASLLWNQWWLTELYKIYHTSPKADTFKRIKKISPKYISNLNQYNLSKQNFQS